MEDQKNVVKLEDKRLEQVVGGLVEKDEKKRKRERILARRKCNE